MHGRYSYRRVAKILLFSFFKNTTLQFTQIWFFLFNGFSGQTYLDDTQLSIYNVIFTVIPIFSLCFFDLWSIKKRIWSFEIFDLDT